eukprot:c12588_g3_i1 orf=3-209(-)
MCVVPSLQKLRMTLNTIEENKAKRTHKQRFQKLLVIHENICVMPEDILNLSCYVNSSHSSLYMCVCVSL